MKDGVIIMIENDKKLDKTSKTNSLLLSLGSVTSMIGNIVFDYANSIWIVGLASNSAKIMGLYQSSQTITNILLNLIGGYFSDTRNRKRLLVFTDILSALICFVSSFFLDSTIALYLIIFANIALAILFSFNSPAYRALSKETLLSNYIGKYNSILTFFSEFVRVLGPVLGLFLMNLFSIRFIYIFNALTFLVSAILENNIKIIYPNENKEIKGGVKEAFVGIFEGIKYIKSHNEIFNLILLSSLVNFFLSGYNLLIPYTNLIFKRSDFYSKCLVAEAFGGIVASIITRRINFEGLRNTSRISISLMFNGISLILFYILNIFSNNMIINLIPIFLFGISLTIFNITFMTNIQLLVDSKFLGRVFSIIFTVAVMFMPIGSIFFSLVFNVKEMKNFTILGIGITILSIFYYGINIKYKRFKPQFDK